MAGVGHGDDLGFFFSMSPPGFPKMVTTAAQKKTQANLLELLESFSQCGTPTLIGAETWQRLGAGCGAGGAGGQEEHLEIGETVKMVTHAKSFADQVHFWKQVNHTKLLNMTKTDGRTAFQGEGESDDGETSTFHGPSLSDLPQNCHQTPLMTLVYFPCIFDNTRSTIVDL